MVKILSKFSLVILSFLLLYYFFAGIGSTIWEGDSISYHVPIAHLLLKGQIFKMPGITNFMQYSPGASEIILSVFMFLGIPLNIYNVFGLVALFFALKFLAKTFRLNDDASILFASTFVLLHGVIRWVLAQTIDVYLATFFAISLALLQEPKNNWKYFLTLGISLGMIFGSKYTGPFYVVFLLLIYGKSVIKSLSLKNILLFLLPFSLLGLFWYIRNYLLTGDPYFPQSIPFFKGVAWHILDTPVWRMFISMPKVWFDSFISEYTVWFLALPVAIFIAIKNKDSRYIKLTLLGILSFVVYFFLPSGPYPNLITSGFRYTYEAFIPFILVTFLFFRQIKKENLLALVAIVNMLILPEISYHPKILILLLPIALVIYKEELFPKKLKV